MKKILALIMAAMMVLSAVSALAAGSPTTSPVVVPSIEEEIQPAVAITGNTAAAEALAAEMSAAEYDAAVLAAETQEAIAAKLPEGVDIKDLVASEMIDLTATAADEPVVVTFGTVTDFTAAQAVVTVLKVADTEIVLENTVNEDGTLAVEFTVDALTALNGADGVLVVLSK